jgi:hypothetical protein
MIPEEAYYKCKNENRRVPKLENVIATDPYYSYLYARDVIKGRSEEFEKSIAIDPKYSYWYALDIIKSPFELCHHIIFNSEYKELYINFLKSINYDLNEIEEQYGEWLI